MLSSASLSSSQYHSTKSGDARLSTFNTDRARQSFGLVSDGFHCQFNMNLGGNSFTLPSSSCDQRSHGNAEHTHRPSRRKPGKTALNKERHFVQHRYRDLLNEADSETSDHKSISNSISDDSFPMKLHRILDEVEKEGLAHIISWQPHGRAFIIRDTALFSRIIMPKYFPNAKKFTSIQRQLNVYGFERLTRDGPDQRAYYHEAFLRGRPLLSSRKMVRRRVKGTGHKPCSNPDAEPDFSTMPFVTGRGSASDVTNELSSLAPVAPTLDGIQASITSEESGHPFCQGSLNQQQQLHQLLFSQKMFQGYSVPLAEVQADADEQIRITTQEFDNEPNDLVHFNWSDAEIWKSFPTVAASQNEQGV